jgi:hypothetical protein
MDSVDYLHVVVFLLGALAGVVRGLIPLVLSIKRKRSVPIDTATGKPSGSPPEDAPLDVPQSITGGQQ